MIVCIPLFLAGCSSSNGVYKASDSKAGQIWYVINSKNNVEEFLFVKGNKVVNSVGLSDSLSNFNGLSNKQALSMAKQLSIKHDEKFQSNDPNSMMSVFINDIPFKYTVASDGKSETIYSPTYFKYKLTNPNTTVTVNRTKYVGYNCYDEKAGLNYKLVTNTNQKLGFDKANN